VLEQTGLGQQAQVSRDARLALAEHRTQLAHGQLAVLQQRQQAQACGFGGALQRGDHLGDIGAGSRMLHCFKICENLYIWRAS